MLTPSVKDRLDEVQAKLIEMGVRDVKIHKDTERWNEMTMDERANTLCDVFEAWMSGRCKPVTEYDSPIGDSVRPAETITKAQAETLILIKIAELESLHAFILKHGRIWKKPLQRAWEAGDLSGALLDVCDRVGYRIFSDQNLTAKAISMALQDNSAALEE